MTTTRAPLDDHWTAHGGARGVARAVERGAVDAADLAAAADAAIERHNASLAALSTVFRPPVTWGNAPSSTALAGLPFVVKENMDVAGHPTTAGCAWLLDRPAATAHAGVVSAALSAGAQLVGRGNMPPLGTAATTVNPHFGIARNPHDPSASPGGSSGGTAAAVAAGMALFGVGSDTGGSVLIPAALTGLYGYRPSTGRLPTEGMTPFSTSLDTPGLLCRDGADLRDVAAALTTRAGVAAPWSTVTGDDRALSWEPAGLIGRRRRMRVALAGGWFDRDVAPPARAGRDRFVRTLVSSHDVEIEPVELNQTEAVFDAIRTLVWAEAAVAWQGLLDGSGPHPVDERVLRRAEAGRSLSAGDYIAARSCRGAWIATLSKLFTQFDAIVSCTVPRAAPAADDDDEALTEELTRFTYPWCLAGLPSVSLPVSPEYGEPAVGIHLTMPRHTDRHLLDLVTRWTSQQDGEHP